MVVVVVAGIVVVVDGTVVSDAEVEPGSPLHEEARIARLNKTYGSLLCPDRAALTVSPFSCR
jgi:hypothetical protein